MNTRSIAVIVAGIFSVISLIALGGIAGAFFSANRVFPAVFYAIGFLLFPLMMTVLAVVKGVK